jgi:hypothetical protein
MFNLSALAFALQKTHAAQTLNLKRTQAYEIFSALLGFQTYAALNANKTLFESLEEAEYVLLQPELATSRMLVLYPNCLAPNEIISDAVELLKAADPSENRTMIHASQSDFIDDVLHELIDDLAIQSDEVSSAMSETNAYIDECYVDSVIPENLNLLQSRDSWSVVGTGVVNMTQDTDKAYSGDKVNFQVRVVFTIVSRVGLTFEDSEVGAGVDDSIFALDHEEELAYFSNEDTPSS